MRSKSRKSIYGQKDSCCPRRGIIVMDVLPAPKNRDRKLCNYSEKCNIYVYNNELVCKIYNVLCFKVEIKISKFYDDVET